MKKIFLSTFLLFASILLAHAQEGLWRINAGLAFGSDAGYDGGNLGINAGAEYFILDEVSASPSFTYYFKSTEDIGSVEYSVQLITFNIDGRYYFYNEDFQAYGIAGIVIASANYDVEGVPSAAIYDDDSEAGLNIGAGIIYPISDKIGLNGQIKYQTPYSGQLVLNAGVAININY